MRPALRSPPLGFLVPRSGGPEPAQGGGAALQLHAPQLLRVGPGGAEEDRHHLLAGLPPGEALRRELRVLLAHLQRMSVCPQQGHQEVSRGTHILAFPGLLSWGFGACVPEYPKAVHRERLVVFKERSSSGKPNETKPRFTEEFLFLFITFKT